MKTKAYLLFILLFFAVGYFMSMANPYLPNTGNATLNYLETGGITAFIVILAWEKWLRKEGEAAKDG